MVFRRYPAVRGFLSLLVLLSLTISGALLGCGKKDGDSTGGTPAGKAAKGTVAPDFTLIDLDGNPVSLSSFKGKVVMLNFWATWCPPCRDEMPSMERLWQRYKDRDMVLLAVSVDKGVAQGVKVFVDSVGTTFPILRDMEGGKLGAVAEKLYGITGVPETFIIDRDGIIQEKIIGSIEWDSPQVFEFFDGLVGP